MKRKTRKQNRAKNLRLSTLASLLNLPRCPHCNVILKANIIYFERGERRLGVSLVRYNGKDILKFREEKFWPEEDGEFACRKCEKMLVDAIPSWRPWSSDKIINVLKAYEKSKKILNQSKKSRSVK